jgi:hypothetical protein
MHKTPVVRPKQDPSPFTPGLHLRADKEAATLIADLESEVCTLKEQHEEQAKRWGLAFQEKANRYAELYSECVTEHPAKLTQT